MKKLISSLLLLSTLLLLGTPSFALAEERAPLAKGGYLSLDEWNLDHQGIVELNGEWQFYWQQLLLPDDFHTEHATLHGGTISVPDIWKGQTVLVQPLSNYGYGTYRLLLSIPPSEVESLKALYIPSIASAYTLWINGQLIEKNGVVGTNRQEMQAKNVAKVVYFLPENQEIEIIFQVSNFVQRKGGMWEAIRFGQADQISLMRDKNIAKQLFISGALLVMGIYHLGLYLFRTKEKAPLYFSLLCLLVALRSFLLGDAFISRLFPDFSWEIAVKLEYLTNFVGPPMFMLFAYSVFPHEVNKKVAVWFLAVSGLYTLLLIFPAHIYTYTMRSYQVILVILIFYMIYAFSLTIIRKRPGSVITFIATIVLFATVISDILHSNHLVPTGNLISLGLYIFLFSQTLVLAMRFSQAIGDVENLSTRLAHLNESLEQKVKTRTNSLVKANQELFNSEKLRRHLLTNISHELGTPMTAILGFVKAMLDGVIRSDDKKYLTIIYDKAVTINRLIKDLYELSLLESRQISFDFLPIRTDKLTRQMYEKFEFEVKEKGLEYHLIIDSTLPNHLQPTVNVDSKRIEQVVTNLIYNAIKFTAAGGRITIKAEITEEIYRCHVIDTGIGISEEALSHVFQRFYQEKNPSNIETKGTGLGLAISKEIIEYHEGVIGVESSPGKGSRFYFELPIHSLINTNN